MPCWPGRGGRCRPQAKCGGPATGPVKGPSICGWSRWSAAAARAPSTGGPPPPRACRGGGGALRGPSAVGCARGFSGRLGRGAGAARRPAAFAAVPRGEGLTELGVEVSMRVKGSTQVYGQGQGRPLRPLGFAGTTRWRNLGRRAYCASAPPRLGVTLSRARDPQGQGDTWPLLSTCCRRAHATAAEYARRFGGEPGCRDPKGELGFAPACLKDIHAWSRLFALFALALVVVRSVAVKLLAAGGPAAVTRLRRVASPRRGRWDLSLVSAIVRLLHADKSLLAHLSPYIQFNLDARLIYVS